MTGADWLLLVAIGALFLVSGVLAMAETAFTRMSRVRALALEEEGRSGATRLARLLERPERTLNSLLLVILVCQLVSANLTGVLLEQHFGTLGFVLGIVVEIAVFFVFFEVVPKTFAIQHTDRAVLLVSPVLSFLTNFPPLRVLSRGLSGLANVVLPGRGLKEGPFVSEEEIRQMADVAADEEAIERDERKLIHSIFEFGDMVVREAMTPRTDMVSISADATIEEGITAAIEGGYSRIPAYEESTDNIIGLVFLKDLVALARASKRNEPIRTALREAVFVPEQKRVAELLREMQTKQFHMAIVIDEYGGASGLLTPADIPEGITRAAAPTTSGAGSCPWAAPRTSASRPPSTSSSARRSRSFRAGRRRHAPPSAACARPPTTRSCSSTRRASISRGHRSASARISERWRPSARSTSSASSSKPTRPLAQATGSSPRSFNKSRRRSSSS